MNRLLQTISFIGLTILAPCVASTTFPWSSTGCDSGYDYCGILEFCSYGSATYGYRLPGETACGLETAPVIRLIAGQKFQLTLSNKAAAGVITNIHTHGLHISGDGNADDVTRHLPSGECMKYNWDIPADHSGGTYWYHAHHHGQTNAQVSGGAFGMLIVEESINFAPDAGISAFMANERLVQVAKLGGNTQYLNGVANGVVSIVAGEWYRFRVSMVDPKGTGAVFSIGSGCEARAVAYDGVWRSVVPAPASSSFPLTGSSRIDLAVRCFNTGSYSMGIGNSPPDSLVVIQGSENPTATPFKGGSQEWSPSRPYYLANLADTSPDDTYSIAMTAAQINGVSWDADTPLASFFFDDVQEWTLSGTNAHPFHMHLYHMQIMQPGGCGDGHPEGEWFDTIATTGDCVVRFRFADHGGRAVLHCHVLSHEDNGAMSWVDVVGGPAPEFDGLDSFTCPANGTPTTTDPPTSPPTNSPTTSSQCAGANESCSNASCCAGLQCSNGRPSSRFCY